jgi:hypothetical protein
MNTCVCDRCQTRWSQWLSQNRPELDPLAPEVFLDDPLNHLEHYNAWWYFRANLTTQWYTAARQRILESIVKHGSRSGVKPYFASYTGPSYFSSIKENFMNGAEVAGVFDRIFPMLYASGDDVREGVLRLVRIAGKQHTFATLNMGLARSDRGVWRPGELRAQMRNRVAPCHQLHVYGQHENLGSQAPRTTAGADRRLHGEKNGTGPGSADVSTHCTFGAMRSVEVGSVRPKFV